MVLMRYRVRIVDDIYVDYSGPSGGTFSSLGVAITLLRRPNRMGHQVSLDRGGQLLFELLEHHHCTIGAATKHDRAEVEPVSEGLLVHNCRPRC